ncbi:MAG: glucose-6-phosphate dehydrogenase [Armatimonadota bacterium]|nr:glucose-6-phosphate dehydrogenase [Armatimonadota bacterium]MDR7427587.1 glucose-6-phosphate dehydrogenase [Armatimonadota bacterium]MDR7464467.1 glucose-6-phosphate dehydrogenase [Armatimonadota bacterium]MDR7469756.1 glucose-6-phosphate dehydrogenase [Armatimonadota bacterium]MDR7474655.1 glucose-6-phosphate dehydrogenase [Armatimonadota bacterium]
MEGGLAGRTGAEALVDRLRESLWVGRTPQPCAVVIFGATGDLARNRLIPDLYNLARKGLLPASFAVVAFARRPFTSESFREQVREAVRESTEVRYDPAAWQAFAGSIHYIQSDYDDPQGYGHLGVLLADLDGRLGLGGNRLYYLATPPSAYATIVERLDEAGLGGRGRWQSEAAGWRRIIIEKPFGSDLETARALNARVHQVFDETEIYRIDHFLGKETVQNLMIFRFANTIFEPIWTRQYVDHVQITVAESVGIGGRGGYYEEAGVVRDILQNHLLQLLTLVAMEPPALIEADAVRNEKVKILHAIRPFDPGEVERLAVRGQYGRGMVEGREVPGYREEERVAADSVTPTYVAVRFEIDNWRWAGVPFYLRSGKRLPKRVTEIAIQFKLPPLILFHQAGVEATQPNMLALNIQPDEGIALRFAAKVPGQATRIQPVNMQFDYGTSFGVEEPTAYERLLLDAMIGDRTLFARHDEVEKAWALVMPILDAWAAHPPADFPNYEAGTWGPPAARALIERDGRRWRQL